MPLRVALLGFYHETNTFSASRTDFASFEAYQFAEGLEILSRYSGTGTEMGGMIAQAARLGVELVPLLFAAAVPSGLITAACIGRLRQLVLSHLDRAGELDGMLVVLHGAAASEDTSDADGAFLSILRDRLGRDLPIVATTDYHANLSDRMVAEANAIVGYDTYPHTDMAERGAEAVSILRKLIDGATLYLRHVKLPLISAPQCQSTSDEPMRSIMSEAMRIEARDDVLTVSVAMGFPYADSPDLGASVLAYGSSRAAAAAAADDVARLIWSRRGEFEPRLVPLDRVAALAAASKAAPLVLVDPADNVGGGSAGDGTALLAELLFAKSQGAVIVLFDPAAAALAASIGVGGRFEGSVGGRTDGEHGPPLPVSGVVAYARDTSFTHTGTYMTGFVTRMGLTAIVDVGGVRIVLTSLRTMPFDAEQLRCLGIEPLEQRIVVVKSAVAWRAAYGALAQSVEIVDTPGICPSNLHRLSYRLRPRPLSPLERVTLEEYPE